MKYRPEVDGLRALAVVPVILFHAGLPFFEGGFVGVDVFFVISGYLITTILLDDLEKKRFSLAHFYERRARRILPALFFIMACCIPAAWILSLPQEMSEFAESVIGTTLFGSNIVFWRQTDYFAGAAELKPLLHTWSLSIEEQFYLLFPPFLAVLWGIRRGKTFPVLAICIIGAASLGLAHVFSTRSPTANFFLLPSRAWELCLGALVAFSLRGKHPHEDLPGTLREMLALSGMALICLSIITFDRNTPFPSLWALLPTGGTALILVFASKDTFVARLLAMRYMVAIGLVSYSAYLWHQPLFAFTRQFSNGHPSTIIMISLAFSTMVLAWLSWKFIEDPFRDSRKVSRRKIFLGSAIGMVFFVVLGVVGVISNGFPTRYDSRFHDMLNTERDVRYQARESMKFKGQAFANDGRPRLLIVGDSYSADVVNALAETDTLSRIDFSWHRISADCGNLYLNRDISSEIEPGAQDKCRNIERYESDSMRERLRQADEVWIVSAWSSWVADYLPQSIRNLQADYGEKFLVFGTKGVGSINLRSIMEQSQVTSLEEVRQRPRSDKVETNERMREAEYRAVFVDLFEYLCEPNYSCPIVTIDGALISFDGGHLTPSGARLLGQTMLAHPPSRLLEAITE